MRYLSFMLATALIPFCFVCAEEQLSKSSRIIKMENQENSWRQDIQEKERSIDNLRHKRRSYELFFAEKNLDELNVQKDSIEKKIKNGGGINRFSLGTENSQESLREQLIGIEQKIQSVNSRIKELSPLTSPISSDDPSLKSLTPEDISFLSQQERLLLGELSLLESQLNASSKTIKVMDPLPLANWINVTQIPTFFDPLYQTIAGQDDHFNRLDSLGQYYLDIQPYGFYSQFELEDKNQFKMWSAALALQGGLKLAEKWMIGAGTGYWHSHLNYIEEFTDTAINSFYLGPFVSYFCDRGYIELRALGVYNSYSIKQEELQGWDLDLTLEGGVNIQLDKLLGPKSFIKPNIKLGYLFVWQNDERADYFIKTETASFLSSCLAAQIFREFSLSKQSLLIPSLSAGWVLMQPLTQQTVLSDRLEAIDYESCNQAYLEAKLSHIHKRGITSSLGFEAYIGKLYPVYAANIKLGFDW